MTTEQQTIVTSVQGIYDYRYGTDFNLNTTQEIKIEFNAPDMTLPLTFPVNSNVPYNEN